MFLKTLHPSGEHWVGKFLECLQEALSGGFLKLWAIKLRAP